MLAFRLVLVSLVVAATSAHAQPAQDDTRPLPDTTSLLEQVLGHQDALEAARADCTYTKTVTKFEVDGSGRSRPSRPARRKSASRR